MSLAFDTKGVYAKMSKEFKDGVEKLDLIAKKNSAVAVEYAADFSKSFDYSERSIGELEEILDVYSKDLQVSRPTENQIWSMSVIFGSYLGETMLKNGLAKKGYVWGTDGTFPVPLLVNESGWRTTPNDKVYKRLVNGSEDNVLSYYRVFMKMVMDEGKF